MKTFVLFGSTGDLATRYVLPALGTLLQKGVYDHLVCVGRRDWSRDDFRNFLAPYSELLNHTETISYVRIDIDGGDFTPLKEELEKIQNNFTKTSFLKEDVTQGQMDLSENESSASFFGSSFKKELSETIYHLCLSPEYFVTVAKGLASVGLNDSNTRVMIEKPFGHDLKTAIKLNLDLQDIFHEDQIYRVDHYLGKNFVQELYQYRIEQGDDWYSKKIKEIRIIARETVSIEGRGAYYDKSGATRDFIQNHLLQILAMVTMEMPHILDNDAIRNNIARALTNIAPLLLDPRHDIIVGQYAGYKEEKGVEPNSRTETYIKTNLTIDDPLWKGTHVVLETGKALDRKESSVTLVFQDGTEKVFTETAENKNNAYEALIEKAFQNDVRYFVRWDSVRAAWQVVDELLHCTDNCPILQIYEPGSSEV